MELKLINEQGQELSGDEQVAMLWNLMVREGYGIAATERSAPGGGAAWVWDRGGADARRMDALREQLIADTALRDDTPTLLTGFSDGGIMAASFTSTATAMGWPVFAATSHSGVAGDAPNVPTMFVVTEHDKASAIGGIDRITRDMDRASVEWVLLENPERIVTPPLPPRRRPRRSALSRATRGT